VPYGLLVTVGGAPSTALTLAFALVLAGVHLLAPRIRALPVVPRHAATSFGGGIATAYLFLYLLPRLAEGNRAATEALGEQARSIPLGDLVVFLAALLGFFTFYALEHLTLRSEEQRQGREDILHGRAEASRLVFALQLAFFAGYSAVITYTLPTKLGAGLIPGLLFAVAMAMHLVGTDQVLQERFRASLTVHLRLVLAGGALAGWLVAAVVGFSSPVLINLLAALLSGAILFNVVNDEVPPDRHSSFAWFSVGLVLYAVLLVAATYVPKLSAG
jgi:hypothetical protein